MEDAAIVFDEHSQYELMIDEYKQLIYIAAESDNHNMIEYYREKIFNLRDKTQQTHQSVRRL